jgi:hypothetical protein
MTDLRTLSQRTFCLPDGADHLLGYPLPRAVERFLARSLTKASPPSRIAHQLTQGDLEAVNIFSWNDHPGVPVLH